jgi:hypothetical protein
MRNRVDNTGMGSRVEHIILERTVGLMLEIMEVNRKMAKMSNYKAMLLGVIALLVVSVMLAVPFSFDS